MSDFAERAGQALEHSGYSITAAARALNYDRAFLSRVLNRKQQPSLRLAQMLDDLTDSGGDLYRLVAKQSSPDPSPGLPVPVLSLPDLAPDPDLNDRITRTMEGLRHHVDASVIEWLHRCLAEHRKAEDTIGAGPVIAVVQAQLSSVSALTRNASGPLADQLTSLVAQYAQFVAWMCNDLGDKAAALGWYDRAHDWAMEAGDASMAATALSMKAHLAWSVGNPTRTVRLSEAARWHEGRITPGVQGMATQMTARGHALGGDASATLAALDTAERLIRRAAEHPEDEPSWMYFYGETWLAGQRGMIMLDLVERTGRDASQAIAPLELFLNQLPATYVRDRAWYGACLARAHSAAGDLDAASQTARTFAPDAVRLNRYAADDLRTLHGLLSRRMSSDPGIRELGEVLQCA
ncbi:hypothetical protein [Streptomyces aidingensis]|nr:hypothetical protein [Streptomyces aidingensis]